MILAIGVFHGSFSDSNGLPILWMSFSKVSMMTNDCMSREFSGDPVVRTQYFHCCGPRLMVRKLKSQKQHVMARKRHVELKWNHTIYWDSSFSNTLSLIYWYFNHFFFFFWKENLLYFGCQQDGGGQLFCRSFVSNSCDPMDCSLPRSSVHGISQARILEWVAISFSRGSSQPRDQTCISCIMGRFFTTEPPGKPCSIISWKSFLTHMHFFLLLASFLH